MTIEIPDVVFEPTEDGDIAVAANKKARRFLNKGFRGGRMPWAKVSNPAGILDPREYRAIVMGKCPALPGIVWALHSAGFTVMHHCSNCGEYHMVTDDAAHYALKLANGDVADDHPTVQ